jgi:acyl-CoA synthetase (AMP-forming)/AMP-acid ligase II
VAAGWNFADVWEAAAARFPHQPALVHGDQQVTWAELDQRANGLAHTFLAAGLPRQAKVGQYLRNRPEYVESMFAMYKAGLVPVNTNYRYGDDELAYLWSNSDSAAVVFEAEFAATADRVRRRLPEIGLWLCAGPDDECPDWATPYGKAALPTTDRAVGPWGRSGDDLYLLYTGGTTGQPKGVMWRQDDLFRMLEVPQTSPELPDPPDATEFVARLRQPGPTVLPAAPLMHGTACWFSKPALSRGGAVVTLTARSLDIVELLDTIVGRRVKGLCIVGEAFVRPMLRELDADPQRWDLSGLRVIMSSGAMLSHASKQRLLTFAPRALIVDSLGSSESGSLASSVTDPSTTDAAAFKLGEHTRVIDEGGHDVVPGSGQAGLLAVGGLIPLGYYGDQEKTASTFRELGGRRYVVAGDWAKVETDGTITLLGRGSSCINTAGEKVFPEEVEEVLKSAAGIRDAAVVGLPDERFGERVVALVELDSGHRIDESALIDHVKSRLASYKAPRRVIVFEYVGPGTNGKLDHRALKEVARTAER